MCQESIQVTDSLGTFHVLDPAIIPAEIRKRRKNAEAMERARLEEYNKAHSIALIRGFYVLSMLREPNRMKRSSTELIPVGSAGCPVVRIETLPDAFGTWNVETADGSAVVSFHCSETIVSALVDFNGFPWLLFTFDNFTQSEVLRAYTIGVSGSVHALHEIRNVSPADFEEPKA